MSENTNTDTNTTSKAGGGNLAPVALGVKKSPIGLGVAALLFLAWMVYLISMAVRLG